jgi:hypothetical protein
MVTLHVFINQLYSFLGFFWVIAVSSLLILLEDLIRTLLEEGPVGDRRLADLAWSSLLDNILVILNIYQYVGQTNCFILLPIKKKKKKNGYHTFTVRIFEPLGLCY